MSTVVPLVVAALAVYRVSRMVAIEEGPFKLFTHIRSLAPAQTWVQRGLECPICISFWVALPAAWWLGGDVLTWLALSGAAVLLTKWEQKR